ncbi:MAG: hypothetical protein LBC45_02945 [Chlamydiales bacterium]|jgi:hypothetical protein|nr:hypothetical protein [Chlamydiales bacterium]
MCITNQVSGFDQVVHLSKADQKVLDRFVRGEQENTVLMCEKGDQFPLRLLLRGEFISLHEADKNPNINLQILKTCYVSCQEKGSFLFSHDLKTWKQFSDFFSGQLNFFLDAENGLTVAGLDLEIASKQ